MIRSILALAILFMGMEVASARDGDTAPVDTVRIVTRHDHDVGAYTQGLFVRNGRLYESTGMKGRSEIREIRLSDGKVMKRQPLPADIFGEGSTDWKDEIISVSWRDGVGYRWRLSDLKRRSSFRYEGEGWGLTRSDSELVMSDGSSHLRFLDPLTFKEVRRIEVRDGSTPISNLNELEWINGEIWANVWMTGVIARIDPNTGQIRRWVDISSLARLQPPMARDAVPNGIAWDRRTGRIYVTGKNWPSLYAIEIVSDVR